MPLKRTHTELRVGSPYRITADETDQYTVYTIAHPTTAALHPLHIASAGTAGTSANNPLVINNRLPDYPRSVQFAIAGSAAGMAGTLTINGKDQFGATISESMSFGTAANGGTVAGTKVFAQFTSGTVNFGTAVGAGTPSISFNAGTNALFGLPVRLGAATDVVHLSQTQGTGAITVNGGTIAGFVNVGQSAIRPASTVTGTTVINVWVKSSFVAEDVQAGLTQAT